MPATATPTHTYRYLSFLLSYGGAGGGVGVSPEVGTLSLAFEPGGEDTFYFRRKLGGPLVFAGPYFQTLYAIERSADRCKKLYLTLEARERRTGPVTLTWRGSFTCNEVEFNLDKCTATVSPVPADGYQELFDTWDRPVNLLAAPNFAPIGGSLRTVKAQLADLPQGQSIEFERISTTSEADYVGVEGWAVFLRNTSFISSGEREADSIVFRYVLKDVPMEMSESGSYEPRDLSGGGWQFFQRNDTVALPTADYVKAPEISGFRTYLINSFNEWWHTEGGRRAKYGTDLLLLPCGAQPSNYGFSNQGYIQVTGPGGAFNQETKPCLNLRRRLNQNNSVSLWWKFGQFSFTRCFPFLDGLYHLLQQCAPQLLPPQPTDLSAFLTHPTNPATKATGELNEIPNLYLSAGSDIKRYGSSEPATRLLVSPKQFITDACAMWDLGYDIDPATGWFRLEHRSFYEGRDSGLTLDLSPTSTESYVQGAAVPGGYTYLNAKLPQYEQLEAAAAVTEEFDRGISFRQGESEYSGACVNTREGENTSARSVTRLTGDLAGLVLSGDSLPDSAIAILDVAPDNSVRNGNRSLAVSELLRRYHTYGRVRPEGIVRASTTEEGEVLQFDSVRLSRVQAGVSVRLCSADLLTPFTHVFTQLSRGGRLAKATLDLTTGVAALTVHHPAPESLLPGPLEDGRQFSDSFPDSFR